MKTKSSDSNLLAKTIGECVSIHVKKNPEFGWLESVTSLSFVLSSLIHECDLNDAQRAEILEKVIFILSKNHEASI